jgi:hypothetical protein
MSCNTAVATTSETVPSARQTPDADVWRALAAKVERPWSSSAR